MFVLRGALLSSFALIKRNQHCNQHRSRQPKAGRAKRRTIPRNGFDYALGSSPRLWSANNRQKNIHNGQFN